jgi:hypothetical protein
LERLDCLKLEILAVLAVDIKIIYNYCGYQRRVEKDFTKTLEL